MAYPGIVVQGYSFTGHSVALPSTPHQGDKLDQELAALRAFTASTNAFLQTSLDAAGALKAGVVEYDHLSAGAVAALGDSLLNEVMPDVAALAYAWAEHMDGDNTIPPEVLARTGVTGDHWSARWWANRAAQHLAAQTALAEEMAEGGMLSVTYDPQGVAGDAFDRANHTGTQAPETIDGLVDALLALNAYDSALAAADAALDGRLTGAEADIATLDGRMFGAEADIATLGGDVDALVDTDAALDGRLTTAETVLDQLAGRNRLINGGFDFWQRGTSLVSSTGVWFLADRWMNESAGSSFVSSRQAFALGQTDVPGEPAFFHRTVVTSVAGAGNLAILQQRIEGVRSLAGQTVTLSFYAKANAAKNIAIEFLQNFGSGTAWSGSVTAIGAQLVALTTAWQRFEITVAIPSIAGKTIGTNGTDFLNLIFWFDAGSNFAARSASLGQQSGTFDIAQVQLEVGGVATPFDKRLPGHEFLLCERYYETTFFNLVSAGAATENHARWRTKKRAAPTLTLVPDAGTGAGLTGYAEHGFYQNVLHSVLVTAIVRGDAEL